MNNSSNPKFGPVVIVGGAGLMGTLFCDLFRSIAIPFAIVEVDTSTVEREKLLRAAGVVVISVPIPATVAVVEQIVGLLSPECLLLDVTSVKEQPLKAMMRHSGEVLGLHPMFGPGKGGFQGQIVVVCPGRPGARAEEMCRILTSAGALLKEMSAARHDQLMAIVQGMNHFHSIVFAHALKEIGIPIEDTLDVASPVYLLRMQLMGRILAQDAKLYADILLENPYVPAALNAFMSSSSEFIQAISAGSKDACVEFFTAAASSLGDYRETALAESNAILSRLMNGTERK